MDDVAYRMAEWWEYYSGQTIPQARAEIARLRESAAFWESCAALNEKKIEALEAQVRAADALAEQVQRVKDFRYDPNIGIELNRLEEALTAYRATKEGGA